MPSPDLRAYHRLTLFDRDARDLVERATADAVVKLPGWVPREGNTELVLIEALSLIIAELVFTVNRLPDAVVEVLMRLYGIVRDEGAAPTATVTFNLADTLGHQIPAGTRLRLTPGGSIDPVDFLTDTGLTIAAGSAAGTVAVTGQRNTADVNGTAIGVALELVDAVPYVNTVELATAVTGGADAETDDEWRDRAITRFGRLVETLVLPAHFTAAALEHATVFRATTIDNHDGTNPNNGHVAVAVAAAGGAFLAAADKTALEDDLEARALASLDVHIIDPTITTVAVTATVKAAAGHTAATVEADVKAALNDYLNPDTWPWAATVRRFELVALIDGVDGVDYVVSLDAPAADVALSGLAPLADAGVLTITVT